MKKIDYIFETSWEICNKVGGIYTVISTKAITMVDQFKDNYICIGPDISRESDTDSDFIEDPALFRNWKEQALKEGLRIRTGRWNIKGNPIVILVDFTPFFERKNDIFTQFWLQYKLDSISGQWDYIEPALFGYAAAKVIESYYNFYCYASDGIIAQFHEWMTGTGILYLKSKVPQVSTVFTTHATVLGRAIAGNGLPLYGKMEEYDPEETAVRFGVQSKQSLEAIAANEADAFTTVSAITGKECTNFLGKNVDALTINGFENDFVPQGNDYNTKRTTARKKLISVATALLQDPLPEDTLLVITSGRYEYRNKGLDLFIESLAKLKEKNPQRELVAFFMVPAGISGERDDLIQRMKTSIGPYPASHDYVTHPLHDPKNDPIINGFDKYNLDNSPASKVKVIFVPVYLNGHDGIFNMSYYDLLIGFDLSVFPSYYEPWGYTPLESAAFGIPTVTTSLAGFGKWVSENFPKGKSVWVVERDDNNDREVSDEIADALDYFLGCSIRDMVKHAETSIEISQHALWRNLFEFYQKAYEIALFKSSQRHELYKDKSSRIGFLSNKTEKNIIKWNKITIKSDLPAPLDRLTELANNLWWSWNYEARELFEEIIGIDYWKQHDENPVFLLQMLPLERIELFKKNQDYLNKLDKVYHEFKTYMGEPRTRPEKKVAYFSMEFGISNELKIFSGGLGMLAGDYLKEASDSNVDMIGVGLLYRCGYFTQEISASGEQVHLYPKQSFSKLPIHPLKDENDQWFKVSMALPGRNMYARIWRVDVGRIPLYLLDTDFTENWEEDRKTTASLYGGDPENRIKQEILLGIGGIRLLNLLGIKPSVFHLNEGHAAFLSLERLRNIMQENHLPLQTAIELVRASSLYTTHTPVPAGHDTFSEDLMRKYFSQYPERYNITWEEFMALGRSKPDNHYDKFSMSILACRLCQEVNGVSRLHGKVTRKMFAYLYEGHFAEELHVGYVTNGVHYPTWTHKIWQELHAELFGDDFKYDRSNPEKWKPVYEAPNEKLWDIKNQLKNELIHEVKELLQRQMMRRNESPSFMMDTLHAIHPQSLLVGFARRFATYKRAHLLFSNEEKLNQLVNNPEKPVTFLFAGKAHPNDKAGQDLIKKIIEFSRKPNFIGKILFVENYDMRLAKKMVSGCDVWLNTPTRLMEASGTSGEKAVMNGVLNFSVADGWWAEGYVKDAGWEITEKTTYENTALQDELDVTKLYYILEEQITPAFYQRNEKGIPDQWVTMMKNNFFEIAPHFTMKRQLDDYYDKYYRKLETRSDLLRENNMENAAHLVQWKNKMLSAWDNIEIVEIEIPNIDHGVFCLGTKLEFTVKAKMGNIKPENVKLEVLFSDREKGREKLRAKKVFRLINTENNISTYHCETTADYVGEWNWAIRMIPHHDLLPHDTDFNLVKWI